MPAKVTVVKLAHPDTHLTIRPQPLVIKRILTIKNICASNLTSYIDLPTAHDRDEHDNATHTNTTTCFLRH